MPELGAVAEISEGEAVSNIAPIGGPAAYTGSGEEAGADLQESNWDRLEKEDSQGLLLSLLATDKERIEVVAAI